MFKFKAIATFWAPVTVITPGGDEQTFQGEFVYLDDAANDEAVKAPNADLLKRVWRGWKDIQAEDGSPLPYSDEARDLLAAHSYISGPTITGYVKARMGLRAKN